MKVSLIVIGLVIMSSIPVIQSTAYAQYYGPQFQGISQGSLPESAGVCISVFIPPKDMNYLLLLAQEVGNHQIKPLNRTQLISLFGNVEEEANLVHYFKSKGFHVVYQSPFSLMVLANASLVEQVFQTKLGLFNDQGEIYYRPLTPPVVPLQLEGVLIAGLTNFTQIMPEDIVLGRLGTQGLIPSTSPTNYYGFQFSALYYTPQELQGAYNVTPAGKNVTVAVIDAYGDPELVQDLKSFDIQFHLPPINLTILPVGAYHPIFGIFSGWDAETALDVEAVHTMAPYAHVIAVIASNPGAALFNAVDLVVSEDLAQVVSMSWGLPENVIGASGFYAYFQGMSTPNYPFLDYYFALGAAEGITFFASSGDTGAYDGTTTTYGGVNFPASSPFVTAVGGTSLYLNVTKGSLENKNASANYGFETAWSVLPQYFYPSVSSVSSGGGMSTLFPAPWYQIKYLHANMRELPDVAADANPYTGMIVYVEGVQEVIGGTSLASPLWAGMIADAESVLGHPLGLLNPALYWIMNSSLYDKAFHPIYQGFNGLYSSRNGYNMVTGLGSPNYGYLLAAFKEYESLNQLEVSVSTFSSNSTYPWYPYNATVKVVAYISLENGTIVDQGNFSAYIYTTSGFLRTVPLIFNGTYWNGEFTVSPGDPANIWSVIVNGTSSGLGGVGQTDIDIGDSLVIVQPVPFPFSFPLPLNEPIPIQVQLTSVNGTPLSNMTVNAYLIRDGKTVLNLTLLQVPQQPGIYENQFSLLPGMPQGTYLLVVNSSLGSAYTYLYFGPAVYGTVYTPVIDGMPGVAPGQNVTFFSATISSFGLGLFSSNVTALVYHNGTLVAQVPLVPAPESIQYGVFYLFGLKEANFTIPSNFTQGLYQVIYEASVNTSVGIEEGNFTTWFYVLPSQLLVSLNVTPVVYEGQQVNVMANIRYPNGSEVTQGSFTLTLIPSGTGYESLLEEFSFGVPLQYNSSLREWVGHFQVPSYINGSMFRGSQPGVISGPWKAIVEGTSALGYPAFYVTDLQVMPLTFLGNVVLEQGDSVYSSLYNGSSYSLYQVYSPLMTVKGTNVNLYDSSAGTLILIDAKAYVVDSTLSKVILENSTLIVESSTISGEGPVINSVGSNVTLISTVVKSNNYAFNVSGGDVLLQGATITAPKIAISVPQILNVTSVVKHKFEIVNVTVTPGYTPVELLLNGIPQNFTYSEEAGVLELHIPFNSSSLPSGIYTYQLTLKNGLTYNLTFRVDNLYEQLSLQSQIFNLEVILISVASILGALLVYLFFRVMRR
ncbi:putative protease [Metallosphaera yellowstonensis MK1]|uniref:Putative protease n=1 Tax=Metallosphaera yellowstonensis MK1 TaxID=671065 RepID=H2C7C0_9CREN|nr:protease pro-enzyme activation domain-containing protein [Metallosphaera yellowstonensis]EHP68046.1 putative protease [Metallosphaera yellowstonensis MK1]